MDYVASPEIASGSQAHRYQLSGVTSLRDLAHQAEKTCPVSNAFRNNFEIIVEPTLAT